MMYFNTLSVLSSIIDILYRLLSSTIIHELWLMLLYRFTIFTTIINLLMSY